LRQCDLRRGGAVEVFHLADPPAQRLNARLPGQKGFQTPHPPPPAPCKRSSPVNGEKNGLEVPSLRLRGRGDLVANVKIPLGGRSVLRPYKSTRMNSFALSGASDKFKQH
jgi:hypothetical protein